MQHTNQPVRIAVHVAGFYDWGRQIYAGVARYAHERGGWQVFADTAPAHESPVFRGGHHWNGVIGLLDEPDAWARLRRQGTQIVGVSEAVRRVNVPVVRVDHAKLVQIAVQHLRCGGFRRFAFPNPATSGSSDLRRQALVKLVGADNCHVFSPDASLCKQKPHAWSLRLMQWTRWVARLPKPIGIFAWNMSQARQLVEACNRAGATIPDEVAIVSADDDRTLGEGLEPTITGIIFPAERIGYTAADLMDRLLAGASPPAAPILVAPAGGLRVRQSSDVSCLPDRDVHLALQYIREHMGEPLTVSRIARAISVSRRSLYAACVRVLGHGPHQELARQRIEHAKRLLLDFDWPAARVAAAAGFGTRRNLDIAFRRSQGVTPAAYRAQFHPDHLPKMSGVVRERSRM